LTEIHLSAHTLTCERDGRALFTNLALELAAGDIVELRGANGSGKTTLLRCLAGLTADFAGTVDLSAAFIYLGHRGGISGALTPAENLEWYAALTGIDITAGGISDALDAVGLKGYARTFCQHLSAGQQRRVALARLELDGADVWLLDEPLTALDEEGCALVRRLLQEHRDRGGSAICATHPPLGIAGARCQRLDMA
jgi:heme exporter protein A